MEASKAEQLTPHPPPHCDNHRVAVRQISCYVVKTTLHKQHLARNKLPSNPMGLSGGATLALMFLACICGLIVAFLFVLLVKAWGKLWSTLLCYYAMAFVDFAVYLYARASKAIRSSSRSTSELPHSEIHRRRDLIGGSANPYKYPGMIPRYDSRSEHMLNRYGRYLNVYAKIPDTNATIFRVRSWLRNCEKNHKGRDGNPHCQPLYEDGCGYPLWLIDIEQRCVVHFEPSLSYFALSYVWGQVETAKMERSNLDQLQQPGSLLGPHKVVELPKTIEDAMFLTGFLGHQYLWCDRLCLVQDDKSSKLPQIQQMAEIYARAYCTIIAFDNMDANSGLHGLPCLTRCSHQQVSTSADMKRARWSSRAWTFQEELFSVRIIRLSSHAVKWQCSPLREEKSTYGSNRKDSHTIRSLRSISDIDSTLIDHSMRVGGMFCPRLASLAYYLNLAEEYSQRRVNEQHPEDRFHAFSSVQSILKASYPGAFIQGIPESLLAQCLLWETGASSHNDFVDPITGRKASTWSYHNDFVDPVTGRKASSWSWIGWSGSIYYTIFADKIRTSRTCEGLVSWYVSVKKDSRRYPVSMVKEERWARHRKGSTISKLSLNPSSTGRMDMSLESQVFEHIVPLSAGSPEPSTLEAKNLCSFLHGRVPTARFRVHLERASMKGRPFRVLQCETTGDYAGVLCGRSGLLEEGQVINLIAISEGSTEAEQCCKRHRSSGLVPEILAKPPPNENCRVPPILDKRLYEFYDALWVEYEDGVAYRKDIGRVRKEIWERETLGWVDVTLG